MKYREDERGIFHITRDIVPLSSLLPPLLTPADTQPTIHAALNVYMCFPPPVGKRRPHTSSHTIQMTCSSENIISSLFIASYPPHTLKHSTNMTIDPKIDFHPLYGSYLSPKRHTSHKHVAPNNNNHQPVSVTHHEESKNHLILTVYFCS